MKNTNESLDPKIEALLLKKAYLELSPEEKETVANQLSEEQYHAFRQLLVSSQELKQQSPVSPDPALQAHLLHQFRKAHQAPSFWERLRNVLQYPVPTWQVGLACLVLSAATYFFSQQKSTALTPAGTQLVKDNIEGQAIFTSRSAKEEKELLVLLTGVR